MPKAKSPAVKKIKNGSKEGKDLEKKKARGKESDLDSDTEADPEKAKEGEEEKEVEVGEKVIDPDLILAEGEADVVAPIEPVEVPEEEEVEEVDEEDEIDTEVIDPFGDKWEE